MLTASCAAQTSLDRLRRSHADPLYWSKRYQEKVFEPPPGKIDKRGQSDSAVPSPSLRFEWFPSQLDLLQT